MSHDPLYEATVGDDEIAGCILGCLNGIVDVTSTHAKLTLAREAIRLNELLEGRAKQRKQVSESFVKADPELVRKREDAFRRLQNCNPPVEPSYRLLVPGEIIMAGDEVEWDGNWVPFHSSVVGDRLNRSCTARRPLRGPQP